MSFVPFNQLPLAAGTAENKPSRAIEKAASSKVPVQSQPANSKSISQAKVAVQRSNGQVQTPKSKVLYGKTANVGSPTLKEGSKRIRNGNSGKFGLQNALSQNAAAILEAEGNGDASKDDFAVSNYVSFPFYFPFQFILTHAVQSTGKKNDLEEHTTVLTGLFSAGTLKGGS